MKILVACEESQEVCKAFRAKGHEAYSCDLQECSGGHPEWHIMGDALMSIRGGQVTTMDGQVHDVGKWDMLIAHPPCTYLTVTGNSWFNVSKYGDKAKQRYVERYKSIVFFMRLMLADCEKICVENPIGIMSTAYRKPDCIIHPFYFAEEENDVNCERKGTCLWLKGLKPLEYEIKYKPKIIEYKNGRGTDSRWHMESVGLDRNERQRVRSKTFPGVAKAMADQWG